MSQGLLISRKNKLELFEKSVANPVPENKLAYVNYRNIYNRLVRTAKKEYFHAKINENSKNPKKIWETLAEALDKKQEKDQISKLRVDGHITSDKKAMASEFNTFFTRVGREISESIQPVTMNPEDNVHYAHDFPDMSFNNVTPDYILRILKGFSAKSSCDMDGISTKFLKKFGPEISIPLAHIFNLSLTTGCFPTHLKRCRVVPIFKSGDPLSCDNFRPISMLSSISKILEKMVAKSLLGHLTTNDLLYTHQYGFLPAKSTEHNLLHLVNFVAQALNDGFFA
jgi:potassium voltage-gated channel Eag-related subfamily H protein 8